MNQKQTKFQPEWFEESPKAGSYRSIFKWGDPTKFKHPNRRIYELLKAELNLTDDDFKNPANLGQEPVSGAMPTKISEEIVLAMENIVGMENISTDLYDRLKFASGKTIEEAARLREGDNGPVADLVVYPRHKEDIAEIVTICDEKKIPVHVYSGGSSVNFGFQPTNGSISLVMSKHMNRFLELNEINQTARVQPGILGPEYERHLNNAPELYESGHRFTGGHFPQSFEFSSVGGWVLTLGSGQQSSYFGDAYDIVLSQEFVTPMGNFVTKEYPATATGPKVNDIMKGSEGCLGILVEITMKIFRYQPENQLNFTFMFPDWEKAVAASREIFQMESGRPSVFRISDAEETDVAMKLYGIEGGFLDKIIQIKGYRSKQRCLCIGHTEGEKGYSKHTRRLVKQVCRKFGGMSLTGYPTKKWKHGRYTDPYMREDLHDFGIIIDTLETATTWDNLHHLHKGVRKFIKDRPNTVCMTHASHFYSQGTNLYFIFISRYHDLNEYRAFQLGIIDRIETFGGSLSHHHGVGRLMGAKMNDHLGKEQMDILKAIKRHLDPNNIMNPGGKMGLD